MHSEETHAQHKESGRVRSTVVPKVTGDTLRPLLREDGDTPNSVLHRDMAAAYRPWAAGSPLMSVNDFASEYVRGDVSTKAPVPER